MNRQKELLYRKVNTKARNVFHNIGLDAKHTRHTKAGLTKKMKQGTERGLDYTPLFKFLLSKVGKPWVDVFSEIHARLDKDEPIYYMVFFDATLITKNPGYFNYDNAKFSTLTVDNEGLLQKIKPDLKNEDFYPSCSCCTKTFNGVVLNNKYSGVQNERSQSI
jgi:hypothetical protein